MKVFAKIRWSFVLWRNDVRAARRIKAATKPRKKELFNASGWGPRQPAGTLIAAPYHGPLYPAPSYDKYNPRKASSRADKVATGWCNHARNAWAENKLEEAEADYNEAINASPKNPDFLFEKSQLLWSQGRLSDARACLASALEIDPRFGSARASYLRICVASGEVTDLAANFAKLDRDVYDLGILDAVGNEVRPALGIPNR